MPEPAPRAFTAGIATGICITLLFEIALLAWPLAWLWQHLFRAQNVVPLIGLAMTGFGLAVWLSRLGI